MGDDDPINPGTNNPGRPPINPNSLPIDLNLKLNLPASTLDKGKNISFDDSKGPMVNHLHHN